MHHSNSSSLQALYNYTAQYPDELSFSCGQIITGVTRVSAEWWEGQLDGRKGLVPSNYVEVTEAPLRKPLKVSVLLDKYFWCLI